MKLSVLLTCLLSVNLMASVYSQKARFDLDIKYQSVRDVLKTIEKESLFRFFYNDEFTDLDKKLTFSTTDQSIDGLMSLVLDNTEVSYKVLDNNFIVITPKSLLQQRQVTGTINDATTGEPLAGVNVVVEGTTIGVISDASGKYSIDIPNENAVLIFSFVGYSIQKVSAAGRTILDITLVPSLTGLEEIVVIGYGTASRKDFTGTVSSLKMENSPVSLLPNLNVLESLKGNISGLNIGATNSAGGEPSMDIRGQNSINGSNDPLIVLDGVIYLGRLSDINPNDIASFDILKDAVSASVYGSRSANGVIAITTKRGRLGKPVITFNTSAGIQTWQNMPVMMKGEEWIKTVNARNKFAEGSTDWMKPGELANLADGKETVWLDEVTRTGQIQDYQLAVSGAAENINYYMSSSYNKNKGIIVGDDFNRISLLGKLNTKITKWLEVGIDAGFSRRDYSGFAANVGAAQTMSPYGVMFRDDQGNLERYPYTQSSVNPLWGVDDGTSENQDIRNNYRLNSYAVVTVPWVKALSYRINYLTNIDKIQSGSFYYENYFVGEGTGLTRYEPATLRGFLSSANGNLLNSKTYSYVIDNIINYKNSFDKHSVEATLVATRDYSKYEIIYVTGSDFLANGNTLLGMWGLHKATVQKNDLYVNNQDINNNQIGGMEKANVGYLGRINYSFNDKYFFTGSYRRDGASGFGANKEWANFAALGLAWKITNEDFFKDFKQLSNLKLKLSWGQNGNQSVGPYETLSSVANGTSGGYRNEFSNAQGKISYGLVQATLGNADLGWESTESWNAGFESAWLNNRIFVDLDAYSSKTTDQLFTRNIPVMNGFKTVKASMGQIDNNGIEVTARTVNIQNKDWNWTTSITYWKNNNKLVKLYGEDINGDGKEDDDISNSLFIGKSLRAIYGYEQIGIVQEEDTEYKTLTAAVDGDPKYNDIDGVAGITTTDRKILGYEKENFRLNISNSVSYKSFELYAMVTGTFGGNDYFLKNNIAAYVTRTDRFNDNMTSKPYWTPENISNVYPSAYYSADARFRGLQSRGFVRLQDISFSYTFRQPWVKDAGINSLKVFGSAKNLATITNWFGGDPEVGTPVRENTLPVPTTFLIGANISF